MKELKPTIYDQENPSTYVTPSVATAFENVRQARNAQNLNTEVADSEAGHIKIPKKALMIALGAAVTITALTGTHKTSLDGLLSIFPDDQPPISQENWKTQVANSENGIPSNTP